MTEACLSAFKSSYHRCEICIDGADTALLRHGVWSVRLCRSCADTVFDALVRDSRTNKGWVRGPPTSSGRYCVVAIDVCGPRYETFVVMSHRAALRYYLPQHPGSALIYCGDDIAAHYRIVETPYCPDALLQPVKS